MVKVLFICMGNICRSPTAEGVFRTLVESAGLTEQFEIASAGTGGWHAGKPPDARMQEAALRRGFDLSHQRAQQITAADVMDYDYLVAMDNENTEALRPLVPESQRPKLFLFLDFAANLNEKEVPDPYYGGASGFEYVLDLVEEASQGLLTHIQKTDLKV